MDDRQQVILTYPLIFGSEKFNWGRVVLPGISESSFSCLSTIFVNPVNFDDAPEMSSLAPEDTILVVLYPHKTSPNVCSPADP